ncbi:MAG: PEP-CTERM sorting domain-containing protein [Hyphomicrobiales bacterium]|nr:PEP-CTERM sorting domain-containing protein [Hyphomicrobiales bacterium]
MVYATSNATKLTAVPLPEPSTWALMALGFAGLRVAWRRRACSRAGRRVSGGPLTSASWRRPAAYAAALIDAPTLSMISPI